MSEIEDFDEDALEAQFDSGPDHANLKILPPYYFIGFFLIAFVLEIIIGTNLFRWEAQVILGFLLCGPAFLIFAWATHTMAQAGTPLSPDKPTVDIVETGPYAFSRNPVYLSYILLYLGLVILFDIVWGMALFIPLIVFVIKFVITPEEAYLTRKFKGDYKAYAARVRRWL